LESGRGCRVLSGTASVAGRVVGKPGRRGFGPATPVPSARSKAARRRQSSPGPPSQPIGLKIPPGYPDGSRSGVGLRVRLPVRLRGSLGGTRSRLKYRSGFRRFGAGSSRPSRVPIRGRRPQCGSRSAACRRAGSRLRKRSRRSLPTFLPTRLETRTKESNSYASSRAFLLKLECAMNVKALVRELTGDPRCLCPPCVGRPRRSPGAPRPLYSRSGAPRAYALGPERW
jgi:hypothetical protein